MVDEEYKSNRDRLNAVKTKADLSFIADDSYIDQWISEDCALLYKLSDKFYHSNPGVAAQKNSFLVPLLNKE